MNTRELEIASHISQTLAVETGDLLNKSWEKVMKTEKKDIRDIVTEYDIKIEAHIVDLLKDEFPSHGFLLEENEDINPNAKYKWVIDPIDGTKYFAGHVPLFTVSIGLIENNIPILGTVYNPISHQLYSAYRGLSGFYKNDDLLTKADVIHNKKPIICVDESGLNSMPDKDFQEVKKVYLELTKKYYRTRALGQGSLSLIWLCLGAFDAYIDITGNTKKMDVMAGLAVLTSFGGVYEFVELNFGKPHLIAATSKKQLNYLKNIL